MTSAVPAILKYLSDSSNYNIDQNMDTPVRAKKRRLDHLSWEEKLQRKKLKNRVAAQTSRDRKKAKMDQMEKAIQELFSKNEVLLEECNKLKSLNERLSVENAELRTRLTSCSSCSQNRTVECEAQSGSTARNSHTLSSGSEAPNNGPVEDCIGLPSLPDLLDELNNDVDISSLEQLTQSLLQDIARDLEAAAEKADIQEQASSQENNSGQVVGTSPKQLESDGSDLLIKENQDPLIKDISQYLLLHHNYSAKPLDRKCKSSRARTSTKCNSRQKPKNILPKAEDNSNKLASFVDLAVSELQGQSDVVYGTFDENTNCITIIVEDESCLEEVVDEEILVESDHLAVPSRTTSVGSASPISSSSSDCGYESIGSPDSLSETNDIWDDRVSELFPTLI